MALLTHLRMFGECQSVFMFIYFGGFFSVKKKITKRNRERYRYVSAFYTNLLVKIIKNFLYQYFFTSFLWFLHPSDFEAAL